MWREEEISIAHKHLLSFKSSRCQRVVWWLSFKQKKSQIMTSVKVALRIKPIDLEEGTKGSRSVVDIVSEKTILIESQKQFTFDAVFSPLATQSQLFNRSTKELADQFLDGFNCTVLSYGQSGSGKVRSFH
jgi:hypothetical protein